MDAVLTLLPREVGGLPLRHALEVRHPSFQDPRFVELARRHKVAIVYDDHERFPRIDEPTADFTYARLMATREDEETGDSTKELDRRAKLAKAWGKRGDAFVYVISGDQIRHPAAAPARNERRGGEGKNDVGRRSVEGR